MNPEQTKQNQNFMQLASQIVAHPVGSVTLAPESSQPAGATGDARVVMLNFTDGILPVCITIADMKMMETQFGTQSTNLSAASTKAAANQAKMATINAMTTGL